MKVSLKFLIITIGLLITASQTLGQKPIVVRSETSAERIARMELEVMWLEAAAAALEGPPPLENADKIQIIAPSAQSADLKPRPEQPTRKNEHWADPACESFFQMAAGANLDLIGNEDGAKRMFTKKEWKVLAPCLVELRKEARATQR